MKKNVAFLSTKNQNQLRAYLLVFVFYLFAFLNTGSSFSQEDVLNFYFDPPDGTTFIETVRITQEIKVEGETNTESKISENKSQFKIYRRDFGYSVESTPVYEGGMMEEDVEAILSSLASSIALIYDLDNNGQLIRVRGVEQGMQDLKKKLPIPPELWDYTLELFLGGKTLEQVVKYQWINRGMLGLFAGQTMYINKEFSQNGNMPLPDGSTTAHIINRLFYLVFISTSSF